MKRIAASALACALLLSCDSNGNGIGLNGGGGNGSGGNGNGNGGNGNGGTGGGPTETNNCGQKKYDLKRQPAELLLVLDRSGSMDQSIMKNGPSKWSQMAPAVDQVVMATQGGIFWGLKTFPSGSQQCAVDDTIKPDLMVNNYMLMSSEIKAATPQGNGTPTRMALNIAVKHMM